LNRPDAARDQMTVATASCRRPASRMQSRNAIDKNRQKLHSRAHEFAPRPPHRRSCAPPFGGGVGFADALS
jgi:hypothetical protein